MKGATTSGAAGTGGEALRASELGSTGAVNVDSAFDAYGSRITSASGVTDPHSFYGAQWGYYGDAETGLELLGQRYYDPQTARFITRDPIGFAGGSNLYGYCGDNPMNAIDPSGLSWMVYGHQWGSGPVTMVFDNQTVGGGMQTGLAATASAFSFGAYNGGKYRCDPGFATSSVLAGIGRDALMQAAGAGLAAKLEKLRESAWVAKLTCKLFNTGCFAAGTPVHMAAGTWKPIEDVKVGDKILSRNPKTGKDEPKTVLHTFVHHGVSTLVLKFSDGNTIETTAVHPFYAQGEGFVQAGKLKIGEKIVTDNAGVVTLKSIEATGAGKTVYNIEVADDHTYFVGKVDGGVWVHNANCFEGLSKGEIARQFLNNKVLSEMWGVARDGADTALKDFAENGPKDIEGLAPQMLEAYEEIAKRMIDEGLDSSGVVQARLELTRLYLQALGQ